MEHGQARPAKSLKENMNKTLFLLLASLMLLALASEGVPKPKVLLYIGPPSDYATTFKDTFLNVCPTVEVTGKPAKATYTAEVGQVRVERFTWILENSDGTIVARDWRSTVNDAAQSLCRQIKEL
jgi:hypothetical protein